MGKKNVMIGNRRIGDHCSAMVIAEVAQAHDGSLGLAHSYIDAAAKAGADAVKFQTHIADAESSKEEMFRVPFSYEDKSRYDYWKRMEFTEEQWQDLAKHANEVNLLFLSTPFSIEAAQLLERLDVPAWKIGSGEVANPWLLDTLGKSKKPVLLSTGMSGWDEIENAVKRIREAGSDLVLMQCTSKYPTPLTKVGLNVCNEIRKRYDVLVGLSDHSGTVFPALTAIARGISVIELHVTFDRAMFGPDATSSVTFSEFASICEFRDSVHVIDSNPVDKDAMSLELADTRALFNKSVALREPLPKGAVLTRDVLTVKKPGTGISADKLELCVGRRLARDAHAGYVLKWTDLEGKVNG